MDGLLLVDKTPGSTSHDAVQRCRRLLGQRKIGHCGTLDPAATGLLVLTLGKATRLTRFLINAPKVYSGSIRFGVVTDTYDADGEVVAEAPIDDLEEQAVLAAMATLSGKQEQAAPPYSAKKIKGVKYYELARRGEEVPEAHKEIIVYDFSAEAPLADGCLPFRLTCSSGTYVRSLAHDLGERLGCGAHLASLRRLKVGPFSVEAAITLDEVESLGAADADLGAAWIDFDEIPLPFAEVVADDTQERRLGNGQTILLRELACEEGDWIKLLNRRQRFIAVGTVIERIGGGRVGLVQPRIVFH